jgi:hypothetical protein
LEDREVLYDRRDVLNELHSARSSPDNPDTLSSEVNATNRPRTRVENRSLERIQAGYVWNQPLREISSAPDDATGAESRSLVGSDSPMFGFFVPNR